MLHVHCGHLGLYFVASVVLTTAGVELRVLLGRIIASKFAVDCKHLTSDLALLVISDSF